MQQSLAVKTFEELFAELGERARTRPDGSATVAALDGGIHALGKKILEEAGEVWLDNLADEVTLEGSAMDGFVQGPEAVRTVLVYIRSLYDYQKFNFAGPYGDNGWLEDYTAGVRGDPIGNITLVTRNAAGQAQHIIGNYRPRSTLLLLSRLIGDHFAGTPIAEHFASSEP